MRPRNVPVLALAAMALLLSTLLLAPATDAAAGQRQRLRRARPAAASAMHSMPSRARPALNGSAIAPRRQNSSPPTTTSKKVNKVAVAAGAGSVPSAWSNQTSTNPPVALAPNPNADTSHHTHRVYDVERSPPRVVALYREQRKRQTLAMAQRLENRYAGRGPKAFRQLNMTMWEALMKMKDIVDASDPDFASGNDLHLLQTAGMMRAAGLPPHDVATGLIHDCGKVLYLVGGEPQFGTSVDEQWAVVGDTFVVGYPLPDSLPFPEFNSLNPDHAAGMRRWKPGCGLRNVTMSFGHDEYLFRVLQHNRDKHSLTDRHMHTIRLHSLYPWHSFGAYRELEDDFDRELRPHVARFQTFDLYSKDPDSIDRLSWDDPEWKALVESIFGTEPWQW